MGLSIPIYPKEGGMVDSQCYKHKKTPSPSLAFIKENIDVLRTMIKEHDQQAKINDTPRKLAYVDSDKEALARQNSLYHQKSEDSSKNKEPTYLRRSRRLEDQSTTREKARRKRSKSKRKRSGHQETSSNSEYKEGSDDALRPEFTLQKAKTYSFYPKNHSFQIL
uniref:Uncharacterized protein n=1 Tax=Tanacetum cinerariifolium TaxID=118510 RepID=A0A699L987_TANCI|nr:hypothetical protein [Tanacetum cinerariifolium]